MVVAEVVGCQMGGWARFRFACLLEHLALGCCDLMRFVSAANPSGQGRGGSGGGCVQCCAKWVPLSQHRLQYCHGFMGSGGGVGTVGVAAGVVLVRRRRFWGGGSCVGVVRARRSLPPAEWGGLWSEDGGAGGRDGGGGGGGGWRMG